MEIKAVKLEKKDAPDTLTEIGSILMIAGLFFIGVGLAS